MTKASEDLIKIAYKLDSLKDHIGSLNENAYRIAFPDSKYSLFPLFYLANKYFGDLYDTENETISLMFKDSPENGEKIKVAVSTLGKSSVWVDIFAFNMFIEASSSINIDAGAVTPYSPAEIAWALVSMAGIEGALTMPVKTDILAYIKSSLEYDGWTIPPLFLIFQSIEDMYEDSNELKIAKEAFGHLTIEKISKLENFSGLGINNRPDLQNYLTRNQEECINIINKYEKMMFDWTTAIRGE